MPTGGIQFPASLRSFIDAAIYDELSSHELGVLYRVLRAAWHSDSGSLPSIPEKIARLCTLEAGDVPVAMALLARTALHEEGRFIYPRLVAALMRARGGKARRSARAQRAAHARWGGEQPPDPGGPGGGDGPFRLHRACSEHAPSNAPSMLRASSCALLNSYPSSASCARALAPDSSARAFERPLGAGGDATSIGGGAGARAQESNRGKDPGKNKRREEEQRRQAEIDAAFLAVALDVMAMDPAARAVELLRRSAVYKRLRSAFFGRPGIQSSKDTLTERTCWRISLCPWVTERHAAFAVWEATDLVRAYAKRGKTFDGVGHVIKLTGTTLHSMGAVVEPSPTFDAFWKTNEALERIRRANARPQAPGAGSGTAAQGA